MFAIFLNYTLSSRSPLIKLVFVFAFVNQSIKIVNFSSPCARKVTVACCVLLYFLAIVSATSKGSDLKFSAYCELAGVS